MHAQKRKDKSPVPSTVSHFLHSMSSVLMLHIHNEIER
jgi:hypothetical protein